ncbi:hypothetical protein E4T56_gene16759 [Termitomyces sp. T112]|nr:hypothetical protein E4T56_gene16759 [Termitomyces sp. T112]
MQRSRADSFIERNRWLRSPHGLSVDVLDRIVSTNPCSEEDQQTIQIRSQEEDVALMEEVATMITTMAMQTTLR